ncbi:histidine--tRNA ligase [Buchnera aphidicola]|uniref:histidine--tRNA ligase n=1 Tax=Buchnera aphidicola TaxID=9 RepID=UPI0031B84063
MNYLFRSMKGMHDYLPKDLALWNEVEIVLKEVLLNYNYSEIRLPILERTNLFTHSIGDITDIIGKEMYSFYDKKGISITLRPEATVSCVRAVIQHNLLYQKKIKLWYYGPMFRYERPQKGRYRQFYQFGIETFGFSEQDIELELILLINRFFQYLKINQFIQLEINSIGSYIERLKYQESLKVFLQKNISYLDHDCIKKLQYNSLRILDSKNQNIQKILLEAPKLIDFISSSSKKKFYHLCQIMKFFNIKYKINNQLIRGLDYYNDTVFEWKTNYLGSQNTICAGGRYDTLIKKFGGRHTPAVGLAIGMDRLVLLLRSLSIYKKNSFLIDLYIFFEEITLKKMAIFLSENIKDQIRKIKIMIEFYPVKMKKIFQNREKYDAKIILFLNKKKETIIYDIKSKKSSIVKYNDIIKVIKLKYRD